MAIEHLLFEIVIGQEQYGILPVQDPLCILKVLLDILPAHNTLARLGVKESGDGDDFRG
jgi:hypothetical protein